MQAVIVTGPNQFGIQDIPQPEISAYEALVRLEACGICNTTDRKLIDGTSPHQVPYPFVLGHESVGVVEEVGEKVISYRPGDRVTRPYAVFPGEGEDLHAGFGGMAEYGVVRDGEALARDGDRSWLSDYTGQRQVVVPPDLSALDASLAISLAECCSWLIQTGEIAYQRVAVLGTGIAGLSFIFFSKLRGAKQVIALGRRQSRMDLAQELGADMALNTTEEGVVEALVEATGGKKVNLFIDAVGHPQLVTEFLPALAFAGRVAVYGAASDPTFVLPLQNSPGILSFATYEAREHKGLPWACDLLRRGLVPTEKLRTHTWPLEEVETAFEQIRAGEVVKGFLVMSG